MNQQEINETKEKLVVHINSFLEIIADLDRINPDEPIGEERRKMISKLNYAGDVAHLTEKVLADDPYSLYLELAEMCKN